MYNEVFLYNANPTTCPKCGSRTQIIFDLSHSKDQTQVHQCLNCTYEFVMQSDAEFITE